MDPIQFAGLSFLSASAIFCFIVWYKVGVREFRRSRSKIHLYFSLNAIALGFTMIFLVVARIFLLVMQDYSLGTITTYISLISSFIVAGTINFFCVSATYPNYLKKTGIFSTILIIICIVGAVLFIGDIQISASYEMIYPFYFKIIFLLTITPISFVSLLVWFYYAKAMRYKSLPHARRAAWIAISGTLLAGAYLPEILGPHIILNYLRLFYFLFITILYICFTRFVELEWPKKIRHLYLIHQESGIALYDHSFMKKKLVDSQLVAGGISGIALLLQELTQSNRMLKIIDLEDLKILMEHGQYVMGALIAEENYGILRKKLSKFVSAFENQYMEYLSDFTGSTSEFETASWLIEQIFQYEEGF